MSRPLKVDEIHSATDLKKHEILNDLIERRWVTFINPPTSSKDSDKECEYYKDYDATEFILPDIEDTMDANGKLLNQQPVYNNTIQLEVYLQLGEYMPVGRFTRRDIGTDGSIEGSYNEKPFIKSMIYEVEFPDV